MKRDLLRILCCPVCRDSLMLDVNETGPDEIDAGSLVCAGCQAEYVVRRGIPRFVAAENYSSTFGFQWNRFRHTQLDSHTGLSISRERFFRQSGWTPEALDGRTVLDVGCGAGRFTEIALMSGAHVVAMDYSDAVDACRANFRYHPHLNVVQGDLYQLPFRPGTFDFVYSFGVLQHTPDVERAFHALVEPLGPGGRIAVDIYPRLAANILWPKYWLRPLTRRIAPVRLFPFVERMVRVLLPLSLAIGRIPRVGRKLRHVIPVANYEGRLPLSPAQLQEWAILDTFDMLAPRYDQPQTAATLESWLRCSGFTSIEAFRDGLIIGRGRRPGELDARYATPERVYTPRRTSV